MDQRLFAGDIEVAGGVDREAFDEPGSGKGDFRVEGPVWIEPLDSVVVADVDRVRRSDRNEAAGEGAPFELTFRGARGSGTADFATFHLSFGADIFAGRFVYVAAEHEKEVPGRIELLDAANGLIDYVDVARVVDSHALCGAELTCAGTGCRCEFPSLAEQSADLELVNGFGIAGIAGPGYVPAPGLDEFAPGRELTDSPVEEVGDVDMPAGGVGGDAAGDPGLTGSGAGVPELHKELRTS